MSRRGIDYSKWDKLEVSDSSDEDQDNYGNSNGVRVTRLDGPSRITFGGKKAQEQHRQEQQQQQHNDHDNRVVLVTPSSSSSNSTVSDKASIAAVAATTIHQDQPTTNSAKVLAPCADLSASSQSLSNTSIIPASWTQKGGKCYWKANTTNHKDSNNNNSDGVLLFWSQDRYSVTLRVAIPDDKDASTTTTTTTNNNMMDDNGAEQAWQRHQKQRRRRRQWNCRLTGHVASYADRFTAVSSTHKAHLSIYHHSGNCDKNDGNSVVVWLDDDIPYPVHWEQHHHHDGDDDDGYGDNHKFDTKHGTNNRLDWTIEYCGKSNDSSFLTITLYKASPMAGLVLWWNRPLEQCPSSTEEETRVFNTTTSATEFEKNWNEAHAMFRQKIKKDQEKRNTLNHLNEEED